jgi:hypothetical protein
MKTILILIMLVLGAGVRAENFSREELFSSQENAKVLEAIDFICGDIWCEGYYEYKFLEFSCDKKSHLCDLSFQFKESINDTSVSFSPVQVCQLGGVYSLDQIFNDSNRELLKYKFIDRLSNCFDKLADELRGR